MHRFHADSFEPPWFRRLQREAADALKTFEEHFSDCQTCSPDAEYGLCIEGEKLCKKSHDLHKKLAEMDLD